MEIKKMFIDGEWVTGSEKKSFDVINPATEEVIAKVYESSVEDTKAAIAAAKKSFYVTREWRDMDSTTRGNVLLKIADLIEEHADELAMLDTIDNGKPLREAEGDISDGAHCFKYYRVIAEIRAGITWINCYNPTFNEAPWGGYKMSGLGRELGIHGLEEYQEVKQININLTPGIVGWYEH